MTRRLKSTSMPHDESGLPCGDTDKSGILIHDRKSDLNRTIVTVIGGGLSGLAAAHELVERGFLVQVVEKAKSSELPGEVDLGGVARSQYGRVKCAVEHLHADVVKAAQGSGDAAKRAQWLLELIDYTRRPFVQTEEPIDCHLVVHFERPEKPGSSGDIRDVWRPFEPHAVKPTDRDEYYKQCRDGLWKGLVERRRRFLFNLLPKRHETVRRALNWLGIREKVEFVTDNVGPDDGFLSFEAFKKLCELADDHGSSDFEEGIIRQIREHIGKGDFVEALEYSDVARALRQEILRIELRGHASRDGRPRLNQDVSQARAKELNDRLLGDGKDPKQNILRKYAVQVGMGEREPLTDERTEDEVDRNRRAEVVIVERLFPGEHGFRVFPRHYWNTADIMARIPVERDERGDGARTVLDLLQPTNIQALGIAPKRAPDCGRQNPGEPSKVSIIGPPTYEREDDSPHVRLLRRRPFNLEELRRALAEVFPDSGIEPRDVIRQQLKITQVLTMCKARRWKELDPQSWKDFLGIDDPKRNVDAFGRPRYSAGMIAQIKSAAQALLAYSAAEADAHSYGNFAAQLVADQITDGTLVDRLLTAPTTEAWILPWKRYLRDQGVRFFQGELERLERQGEELEPRWCVEPKPERGHEDVKYLSKSAGGKGTSPDFYVLAIPLSVAAKFTAPLCGDAGEAPDFDRLVKFYKSVSERHASSTPPPEHSENQGAEKWMTGVQLYYETPIALAEAHVYYPSSRWGISAVSQTQYWNSRPSQALGFMGVASIDVCQWFSPSYELECKQDPSAVKDPIYNRNAASVPPLEVAVGSWVQLSEAGIPPRISTVGPTKLVQSLQSLQERLASPESAPSKTEVEAMFEQLARTCIGEPPCGPDSPKRVYIPDVFHFDRGLVLKKPGNASPPGTPQVIYENGTKYLTARKGEYCLRPGLSWPKEKAEAPEIEPAINYGRWVLAGSFMATHTRMTTMEASIESGRLAAARIVQRRDRDEKSSYKGYEYNGRRPAQSIQPPRIFDLEENEIPDLEPLKRLDERLFKAGLPHIFDILQLEKRLDVLLRAQELAADHRKLMREQRKLDLEVDASPLSRVFKHGVDQAVEDWPAIPELADLQADITSIVEHLEGRPPKRKGSPPPQDRILDPTRLERMLRQLLGLVGDPGHSSWKEERPESGW